MNLKRPRRRTKNIESNSYKDFETAFSRALDKHAPEKKNQSEQIANPTFRKR